VLSTGKSAEINHASSGKCLHKRWWGRVKTSPFDCDPHDSRRLPQIGNLTSALVRLRYAFWDCDDCSISKRSLKAKNKIQIRAPVNV
jgi:hypothetical protein